MKRLVYTARTITGPFSAGLIVNFKILKIGSQSIDLLSSLKTNKGKEYIQGTSGIIIDDHVNFFSEFYEKKAVTMSSWKEVYESLDVSPLKKYDSLHIFGGIHFPQSDLTRHSKRSGVFPNDRGQLKFRQTAIHLVNIMAIHKAHVVYDIPLHEFAYDCDELCSGLFAVPQNNQKYHLYHIYDMPQYGMRRLDCLQYYLNFHNQFIQPKKEFDFTFGYTVYDYGERSSYIDYIKNVTNKFKTKNIFVKNTVTGENNSVPRTTYLDLISKSKYTLIIPSYDPECFSLYRFIEAINFDCLPLIHPKCRIDQVNSSFGISLDFLVRNEPFTEEEWAAALGYLKSNLLSFKNGFVV